uniref:Uncharacterized protein n=1 Tax=Oxera neriifolia associated virus TaxID=2933183 RepID=A0A9C7GWK9_9VIRU|nr:hypothetical protein 2 [Oxera neriifolia associated virus]
MVLAENVSPFSKQTRFPEDEWYIDLNNPTISHLIHEISDNLASEEHRSDIPGDTRWFEKMKSNVINCLTELNRITMSPDLILFGETLGVFSRITFENHFDLKWTEI